MERLIALDLPHDHEGTVYINPDHIVYFKDTYPGPFGIEIITDAKTDGRIIVKGRAEDLALELNRKYETGEEW